MSLEIYFDPSDVKSKFILATLKYLDIQFEAKEVEVSKGENETSEFKAISPYGKLPALKHGDYTLSRPSAIVKYCINEMGKSTDFYPIDDVKKRCTIDSYLDYDSMDLFTGIKNKIRALNNDLTPSDNEKTIHGNVENFVSILSQMLEKVPGKFLFGDHFTLADFAIYFSLEHLMKFTDWKMTEYPGVKTWHSTMEGLDEVKI